LQQSVAKNMVQVSESWIMELITISQHDHTSTVVVHTWTWRQNIQARSSSFKETFIKKKLISFAEVQDFHFAVTTSFAQSFRPRQAKYLNMLALSLSLSK